MKDDIKKRKNRIFDIFKKISETDTCSLRSTSRITSPTNSQIKESRDSVKTLDVIKLL